MRTVFLLVCALLVTLPAAAGAQLALDVDPGRSVRTRADLERLLEEYDAALASPAYSESVKRSILADSERIRARLRDGDFRVGDRIEIYVQGEPNFPVTVTVEPGPAISLDLFGTISLAGVLRSEIEPHLAKELARFIRDPLVRATAQMRISVIGAVGSPGFYTMPAETLLGDAIMLAGGPSNNTTFDDLRIERAGQRLYEEDVTQQALREGLTLDQLNLQAGDQIVLPVPTQRNVVGTVLTVMGALSSISFLLFQIF